MGFTHADLIAMKVKVPMHNTSTAPPKAPKRTREPNCWEREYAAQLELQRIAGEVRSYHYEAVKLRLADATFLTPDYLVVLADGRMRFDEVKGWERDDAAVKWKVAAELFPMFGWRMVTKRQGKWVVIRER